MGHFSGHSPRKMPLEKFPAPGGGLGVGGFHYLINFLNYNNRRADWGTETAGQQPSSL